MNGEISFETVRKDAAVQAYIAHADATMNYMGYTEHSLPHVTRVSDTAKYILQTLGHPAREVELARIAGYLHDIGNLVNRADHAQSGALMAFQILERLGATPEEIATIVTAIGNHDEGTAEPVNAVAAALILADKTDVRRSRVRSKDNMETDIHDRVNYSARESAVSIDALRKTLTLRLTVDTEYSSVMNYFEIFLDRMVLCRKACKRLGMDFQLAINNQDML
jgi:metal-dependent HD superfamily phosphatase/phosphodiesterase